MMKTMELVAGMGRSFRLGLPARPLPVSLFPGACFYSTMNPNRKGCKPLKTNGRCTFYSTMNPGLPAVAPGAKAGVSNLRFCSSARPS
jgi:hypothetical protein